MQRIYEKRPFKVRNADEYNLSEILNLFVNPLEGLENPFDYENSIIKGRMGSGKTMYLRSNYAYYLYNLVPDIISNNNLILPVFIRLSDFQHIHEPKNIYHAIIIKIIEELSTVFLSLQDANKMACIHRGMKALPLHEDYLKKMSETITQLLKLDADEYVQTLVKELGLRGGVKPKFFELSYEFNKNQSVEIRKKPNPGISDIEFAYKNLVGSGNASVILFIDEAGVLDKNFFKGKTNDSFFEILMNQFRTANYIRTKIAIYPHSYSDILTETRYGDIVRLEENIFSEDGYRKFREKTLNIIYNYLSNSGEKEIKPNIIFEIDKRALYGDCIEQLINASGGNIRRLIQLLDASMNEAYIEHKGMGKTNINHVYGAIKKHSDLIENPYNEIEKEFLNKLITVCKSRGTYKFQFPHMSPVLYKYTSKSEEYNLVTILELGTGRRSTTYAFDYSYCIAHDIPTHYKKKTEKIDRNRSLESGRWIPRVANISEEIIQQAEIPAKIEGTIDFIDPKTNDKGFVTGDDNIQYFLNREYVIKGDKLKPFTYGKRVRFYPAKIGDKYFAFSAEIL